MPSSAAPRSRWDTPAPAATPIRRRAQQPLRRDLFPALALVTTLVVLALIIGTTVSTCSSDDGGASWTEYSSPYDWSNLELDNNGRIGYLVDGAIASKTGVDVSSHQGSIDWQAVAADGIDFAMIRVGNRGYTEGTIAVDEMFEENLEGANVAGLQVGVYFFSQAITPEEAREEALFVLDQLDGRALDMPIVFDHEPITTGTEGRANDVSGETLTQCVDAFCETVEAAGYDSMVYGNRKDMARISTVNGSEEAAEALSQAIGGRKVWLAQYDSTQPTAPFDFAMWQYTNKGSVAGIQTTVDLNILLPEP